MRNNTQFITLAKSVTKRLETLTKSERTNLEDGWDVEHAYYSSALEGSKIDRKEFESLAQESR